MKAFDSVGQGVICGPGMSSADDVCGSDEAVCGALRSTCPVSLWALGVVAA